MKFPELIDTPIFKFPHFNHHLFHNDNGVFIENTIIFAPPGSAKMSLALSLVLPYSPSRLKYETMLHFTNDKINYSFKMSDIHFEIDMALLSSFSKTVWNDIFLQIVDVVSVKPSKKSIIICKNFNHIHNDLIDSFYTYIQHYNLSFSNKENIQIKVIILTDHISFIPENIINISIILPVSKPVLPDYKTMMQNTTPTLFQSFHKSHKTISTTPIPELTHDIKTIHNFHTLHLPPNFYNDHLIIVCETIIHSIVHYEDIVMTKFRDELYEILTYNLDVYECVWYVLCHFIKKPDPPRILKTEINNILNKTQLFFKYYNNNYRPIYHLENIFYYIIQQLHHLSSTPNPSINNLK